MIGIIASNPSADLLKWGFRQRLFAVYIWSAMMTKGNMDNQWTDYRRAEVSACIIGWSCLD
jgi:hypothetical protein